VTILLDIAGERRGQLPDICANRTGPPLLPAATTAHAEAALEAGQAGPSRGRGAPQQRVPQHCRRRSVLLEGGWAVAELAARAVRAAVVCQCGAPHASTAASARACQAGRGQPPIVYNCTYMYSRYKV
jgi:hypothetical protein